MNTYTSGIVDCLPPHDEARRRRVVGPHPWRPLLQLLSALVKALVKLFD